MDIKLDKKVDSADGIAAHNGVYLGVCTAAVLIGWQAVDLDVSFGRQLRQLRKARDLTQEALAQQAYCAIDTIRKIEGGVRRPSRQLAEQFADCLDLTGMERAASLTSARAGPLAGAEAPGGAGEMLDLATPSRPAGTVTFLYTDIEGSAA